MKRIKLVHTLFILSESLYGQGFQVGFRSGFSNWYRLYTSWGKLLAPNKDYGLYGNNLKATCFENTAYLRRQPKKWAIESSISHFKNSNYDGGFQLVFDDLSNYYYGKYTRNDLNLGLSVQHRVFNLNRFALYTGLYTALAYSQVHSEITKMYSTNSIYKVQEKENFNTYNLFIGINGNLQYSIYKNICVNANLLCSTNPILSTSSFQSIIRETNNTKVCYQLGIQHSFN